MRNIPSECSGYKLQLAVLLELVDQGQHLLGGSDLLGAQVQGAVGGCLLQEISVVHHHAAGGPDAAGAGVPHPVYPPEHRAVLQVEIGHRVEGVAAVLLPVQVPGTEPHQRGMQHLRQLFGPHPLVGVQEFLEGLAAGVSCDGRDLLPFRFCKEFILSLFF